MRRIIAELFSSLDGVVAAPQNWHGPYFDESMGERTEQLLDRADLMLLGRNTYAEHAGYWPHATGRMAELMNEIPKLVVSTTLSRVTWQNATLLRGRLEDHVADLKQQHGGDIAITGSVSLVRTLIRLAHLDQLRLIIDPIVLGSGTRILGDGSHMGLELVEAHPFPTGAVSLTYALPQSTGTR